MNKKERGEYNFYLKQGENHEETFEFFKDGEPIDLTTADAIRAHFKRDAHQPAPDLELDVDNGGITVSGNVLNLVFNENTTELQSGIYLYDILLIIAGQRYTYVGGQIELGGVITK